ncbi:putative transporter-like protein [Emericellopsis cladophorae]|uniref:Transporter-like protein n=1 Tax=Emericellopsis cladophorae TaxID=2686198 RepID=A0A9Q0BC41_9HYPO|nr:putative transporter-like protein [Emericellopsis cladophorae]KAI6779947.1 putative transporter-like protein [Emericellopsis cladophorae]
MVDLEKADSRSAETALTISSSSDPSSPRLQPIRTSQSHRSARSHAQRRIDGTDYLENLEQALTPDPTLLHADSDDEDDAEDQHGRGITHTRTAASAATSIASRAPDFEVIFEDNDPESPRHWPLWYRVWVLFCVAYTGWVVVLYSTSYTSSSPGLMAEFGTSTTVTTLGMTTYLLGLACGSVVLAPMSELFGRRIVYLVCLVIWAVLVVPSGVAQNFATILAARFFCAFFGSVMIASSPGTVVDLAHPDYLAFTLSIWSIAPMNAPSTGGIIGGFVFQSLGWRWSNWIILAGGGAGIVMMATCKETYAPTVLKRKTARLRKETGDDRYWCQFDQRVSTWDLLKTNLSRPFVLAATEPILWFMNLWVSLVYGILYLCFVAYPIVFSQHRGWAPGLAGLAFVGIGIGTLLAIFSEPLMRRLINAPWQPRDPRTGKVAPEATALVMAIAAILTAVGQLAFSWTCLPTSIHWAIPIAMGIPFAMGNTLCFIYGANYLAGAYGIFSASALAGNAVVRSVFGGTLPLAGPKMYEALTPQWAGTLLGLLEVVMIPIPFVFWRYGHKIRARSRVIKQLREEQERIDAKRARWAAKLEKRAERQQQQQQEDFSEKTVGESEAVAAVGSKED